ncbi:MAG TPA: alpha/beta hydrolase [Miltoncostaeaceae bacterium]|nr:alpha/beta hydrolase [Miltoncostaeaceae bacterium]
MAEVSFSEDPGFDFAVRCALNGVAYKMSEVGEVLATSAGVATGDLDGWFDAWTGRGRRVRAVAEACERDGHAESAAAAYLRAANYAFAGFWYVLGTSRPERAAAAWREHRDGFEAAMRNWPAPVARLAIPFGDDELDGYLFSPASGGPNPLVVIVNGLDTPISDGMMIGVQDAVQRGYAALVFDGPGQGHALYASGLTARADFEPVLSAALGSALAHPAVAGGEAALIGVSHGGYLAARAAAFEPRVRALVLDPGIMRVVDSALAQLPDGLAARFREGDREGFERELADALPGSADLRFAAAKTPEPFGPGATLYDGLASLAEMDLSEVAGRVVCPALVLDPDDAEAWAGQSKEVAAALGGPVTVERFTAEDGASLDCEILAPQVRNQRVYDWLADVYPRSGS